MKTSITLPELARRVAERADRKRDFVADTSRCAMREHETAPGHMTLDLGLHTGEEFGVNEHAHGQIAARLNIPKRYYDRMRVDAPDLLAQSVNRWMNDEPETRLFRVLDGDVRAFLSRSFKIIDDVDFLRAALPGIQASGATIESCDLSDRRLYVKAVDHTRTRDVFRSPEHKRGVGHDTFDILAPGIVISNSEVGAGAISVQPAVHTQACTNLAIFRDVGVRKHHVGRRRDEVEDAVEIFSSRTRSLEDAADLSKIQDLVTAAFDGTVFNKLVERIESAAGRPIERRAQETVELFVEANSLVEDDAAGILEYLAQGGDFSQWGLSSAVTRYSQDVAEYDRATELELLGGRVVDLTASEWARIAATN